MYIENKHTKQRNYLCFHFLTCNTNRELTFQKSVHVSSVPFGSQGQTA